jgi:hypothetical protein
MTDFLDALEQQLIAAVERRAVGARVRPRAESSGAPQSPPIRDTPGIWQRIRLRQIALGLALAAFAALVALTAAGTFGGGSDARTAARSSALFVRALPSQGHSRLARLNVADPVGGAPWGMRIVRTPTNLVCLQIGQFAGAEPQTLRGIEGDGVVHVRPPPAPSEGVIGNGLVETQVERASPHGARPPAVESCKPAGAELIAYGSGVALHVPGGSRPGARSRQRTISFGLLGPDALSVTYRVRGRSRSQAVEPGTGAYLIVLPDATRDAIVAVTYRNGATICERAIAPTAGGSVLAKNPCPSR